jgi:VCBS repeat-containing protein
VDLSAVAKNNAVNLSFDLLGFGQDNSHVTLSDIRVSGLPQLHDDAASLAEDNLLSFDPYAQADAALRPLLASSVVSAPTHGAITVNADGTFSYTPDLDYFGTDTFSYRLSDGPLDSNLATVNLTVTAVNDAPVAADVALSTAEDTALVIALGAYGSDVDGGPVRAIDESPLPMIVTGPQHGTLVANADGSYSYTPVANYFGADSFT